MINKRLRSTEPSFFENHYHNISTGTGTGALVLIRFYLHVAYDYFTFYCLHRARLTDYMAFQYSITFSR